MADVSLISAFILGFASFFLSVCLLPLIPAFLTFLAGSSLEEIKNNPVKAKGKIFLNTVAFVLGLALFFSLIGVLLQSVLSSIAFDARIILGYIFGSIIIIFGLMMTGLIKIPFLEKEYKLKVQGKTSLFKSFLFGAAFGIGWSPCVSPFLGLILTIAITQPVEAFPLLFTYSLGLGTPFLLVGLFVSRASSFLNKLAPYMKKLNLIFGIIFIILGILIFTNTLSMIVNSLIPVEWLTSLTELENAIIK